MESLPTAVVIYNILDIQNRCIPIFSVNIENNLVFINWATVSSDIFFFFNNWKDKPSNKQDLALKTA